MLRMLTRLEAAGEGAVRDLPQVLVRMRLGGVSNRSLRTVAPTSTGFAPGNGRSATLGLMVRLPGWKRLEVFAGGRVLQLDNFRRRFRFRRSWR